MGWNVLRNLRKSYGSGWPAETEIWCDGMKKAKNKQNIIQSLWSLGEPKLAASLETMIREGIMDDGSVREIITMKQKQKVLAVHEYTVGQMKGKDNRWYSYVIDPDTGKRKKLVAPTEAGLYQKLFIWYFEKETP